MFVRVREYYGAFCHVRKLFNLRPCWFSPSSGSRQGRLSSRRAYRPLSHGRRMEQAPGGETGSVGCCCCHWNLEGASHVLRACRNLHAIQHALLSSDMLTSIAMDILSAVSLDQDERGIVCVVSESITTDSHQCFFLTKMPESTPRTIVPPR